MLVSVGQAAATALAQWLRQSFAEDVQVYDRWPEANVPLFAPVAGGITPRCVVTVTKVGTRQRLDVVAGLQIQASATLPGGQLRATLSLGSYIQPLQLDVWATTDDDRDDMVAQLDGFLNASLAATLGIADDPVRDGVLLPLPAPFSGNVECILDEPETSDTPDAVQRAEYRATYSGEARGAFGLTVQVPTMTALTAAIQGYAQNPGALYQLATVAPNASPPPAGKVTYSTSSTP